MRETANSPDTIGGVEASWKSRLRRIGLAYLWSILLWVAYAPIVAIQNKVLSDAGPNVAFWKLLFMQGAWGLAAGLLTPPVFYVVSRYPIAKRGGIRRVAGYLAAAGPYLIASTLIRWIILPPWDAAAQRFGTHSAHTLFMLLNFFASQIWNYFITVLAAHAYGYFHRTQRQELERAELQQALAASELQSLKSQLHPHFLFNTLQGISTLITSDPRQAEAMVLKLSGLLRTALEYGNFDLIPLGDELKFVETYLELQKMRLEDRLSVQWTVQPETRQMLVPQLILQPLVENAIVHGIACCRGGGWIQIASRRRENMLELIVKNSAGAKAAGGMGLGLQNTKARLKHLYAEEGEFSFEIDRGSVAITTLAFPGFSAEGRERITVEDSTAKQL